MSEKIKIVLKSKIKVFKAGTVVSNEFILSLDNSGADDSRTVLNIRSKTGTYKYYLESLMGFTKYSNPPTDVLTLDAGHHLLATGMMKVYNEIINGVILKELSYGQI